MCIVTIKKKRENGCACVEELSVLEKREKILIIIKEYMLCVRVYIYIYNLYKQWERVLMVLDMFGGKMWKLENKIYK